MVPLIPDHRQNNNTGSLRVLHYKRNDGINDLSFDTKEPVRGQGFARASARREATIENLSLNFAGCRKQRCQLNDVRCG